MPEEPESREHKRKVSVVDSISGVFPNAQTVYFDPRAPERGVALHHPGINAATLARLRSALEAHEILVQAAHEADGERRKLALLVPKLDAHRSVPALLAHVANTYKS